MPTTLRTRVMRGAFHASVTLLVLVFVLGMMVNLYLAFPSNLSPRLAMTMSLVQFHIIAATLTLLTGLLALGLSIAERHTWGIGASLVGVVMLALAYGGGMGFLNGGYSNSASLTMAIGFLGAALAFVFGAVATSPLVVKR